MSIVPGWTPMTKERLHTLMKAHGATDKNMHEEIERVNRMTEWRTSDPGFAISRMGMKPPPGESTQAVRVPGMDYVIHIWDGGMALYRQFCFDFYDTVQRYLVNLPALAGYEFWPSPMNILGAFMMEC
ncbi:hypothetical protein BV20DRAFT_997030 [Pilatotrama ljubarskyi]|nr:hypothetical protein BV20DRAFT_997030 [Pilatotrama ljubarskyi]